MIETREEAQRAWQCTRYALCLSEAARADLPEVPGCPCDRFRRDPEAVRWTDVAPSRLLLMAVLRPEAFEVLQSLQTISDTRRKWKILRFAWPTLNLRRRDLVRAGLR